LLTASLSRGRISSSIEEDVARGAGVQPYRFEPRSNNRDEESGDGELRTYGTIRELRTFRPAQWQHHYCCYYRYACTGVHARTIFCLQHEHHYGVRAHLVRPPGGKCGTLVED